MTNHNVVHHKVKYLRFQSGGTWNGQLRCGDVRNSTSMYVQVQLYNVFLYSRDVYIQNYDNGGERPNDKKAVNKSNDHESQKRQQVEKWTLICEQNILPEMGTRGKMFIAQRTYI